MLNRHYVLWFVAWFVMMTTIILHDSNVAVVASKDDTSFISKNRYPMNSRNSILPRRHIKAATTTSEIDTNTRQKLLSKATIRSINTTTLLDDKLLDKAQISTSTTCSVDEILLDTCTFDYICDAGTLCDFGSDCIDCDPCRFYTSCASCLSDLSCVWCQSTDAFTLQPFYICTTTEIATVYPNACFDASGNTVDDGTSSFVTTCPNDDGSGTISDDDTANNNSTDSCSILSDTCENQFDLVCDVDNTNSLFPCEANSDCFDCDVCQSVINDAIVSGVVDTETLCSLCTGAGCVYCTIPELGGFGTYVPVCSSSSIAAFVPDVCANSGGTPYTDTCTITSSTPAPTPSSSFSPNNNITLSSCDYTTDSCIFVQDGICDTKVQTGSFGAACESNTDCLDCDPCQQLRYKGCNACISQGCYWCASDAICVSSNPYSNIGSNSTATKSIYSKQLTCTNANDFVQTCPSDTNTDILYNDPLLVGQNWVFDQISVQDVWKSGITGAGVGIRINDDGVDANHIEFNSKFNIESSCSLYLPVVLDSKHSHGTTCASIAAGNGNNGACSLGIAPNATVSGCRAILTERTDELAIETLNSSYFYAKMENMHISSNSYAVPSCKSIDSGSELQGHQRRLQQCPFISTLSTTIFPCTAAECSTIDWNNPSPSDDCEDIITLYCSSFFEHDVMACTSFLDLFVKCEYNSLSIEEQFAINLGITSGRNGKGIVYVFAAGNDFSSGTDVNFAGYQNTRFGITVGAVDKNGKHSSFSNGGAALFVSAPGGDVEHYTNNLVALAGGGCTDGGAGTSFATPVVSGVVALMLEANPELSWRDVQGILAVTSTKIYPDDPSWTTNTVGLHHSNLYGFGIVNASAAVNKAKTWILFTNEIEIMIDSGPVNVSIPEYNSDPVQSTIAVSANDTFQIESVTAYLDLYHSSRGDLQIVLTSPSGTQSVLSPGQRPENSQNDERWKLLTVRNRGEGANGLWTLSLVDQSVGDVDTCIDALGWSVEIIFDEPLELTCNDFRRLDLCVNGTEGPLFSTFFDVSGGLSDPFFADANGRTPADACCECGGGVEASTLRDILRSWRLVIYGNDPVTGVDSPPQPAAPATSEATPPSPVNIGSVPTSATPNPIQLPSVVQLPSPLGPVTNQDLSPPISGDRVPTEPTSNPSSASKSLNSILFGWLFATQFLINIMM